MNKNIDTFRQYFESLVSQQINQVQLNNNLNKKSNPTVSNNNSTQKASTTNSALDGLFSLLNDNLENNSPDKLTEIINSLISSGVSEKSITDLLVSLVDTKDDDLVYTRTNSSDFYLTLENNMKFIGGDLKNFIDQVEDLANKGEDIDNYVSVVSKIIKNGDYDDLRRFIDVVAESSNKNYDLTNLFRFTDKLATKYKDNIECALFGIQTLFAYNTDLEKSINILENMKLKHEEGRDNITQINAFLFALKNAGYDTTQVINACEESGNTILFLNLLAEKYGFRKIEPVVPSNFKKIEGMDIKQTLVIRRGESVALHAEAVSSSGGTLSPELLYWSSVQTGALDDGTNYLDLSKLDVGEYDIYVKIGGDYPATDTAKRKVRVLGENEVYEEECEDDFEEDFKEENCDLEKVRNLVNKTELTRNCSDDEFYIDYGYYSDEEISDDSVRIVDAKNNNKLETPKNEEKKELIDTKKELQEKELKKYQQEKDDQEKVNEKYYKNKYEKTKEQIEEDNFEKHQEEKDFVKNSNCEKAKIL
ncbi:MAG: hypothetical protein U0457_13045 [Candidatus Sericytochromatia bacterium]